MRVDQRLGVRCWIKCVLTALSRRSTHAVPIRPHKAKQTVYPAVFNCDTFVDAYVTVYQIHIDQGSTNILGEDHISYCTTV